MLLNKHVRILFAQLTIHESPEKGTAGVCIADFPLGKGVFFPLKMKNWQKIEKNF